MYTCQIVFIPDCSYSQPPADFWEWFSEYLEDDEEIDVKAGGGHTMTIGELCRQYLTKLEWYSTLFPRIPVPVQKDLDVKLKAYDEERRQTRMTEIQQSGGGASADDAQFGQAERATRKRSDRCVLAVSILFSFYCFIHAITCYCFSFRCGHYIIVAIRQCRVYDTCAGIVVLVAVLAALVRRRTAATIDIDVISVRTHALISTARIQPTSGVVHSHVTDADPSTCRRLVIGLVHCFPC